MGRVMLSLSLIKHNAVKTYGGVEVYLHAYLTSVLHCREWPTSRLFAPVGNRTPIPPLTKPYSSHCTE
jgi:hypothetical protein